MRHDLKHTFDTAAELYDRVRPGYPEALFDALAALSELPADGSILEVGCGTGQATLPMARRGFPMVALDLGATMVAIARRNLAAFPRVAVVQGSFEDYAVSPGSFDLVMSATAFHWVDPHVRYRRAAEVLKPGGALGVIGNTHIGGGDDDFWGQATQGAYRRYSPAIWSDEPMPTAEQILAAADDELGASGYFEAPVVRGYPWRARYDARGYLDLLNTYSGHISLPDDARAGLYGAIAELIDTRYGGAVTKAYLATLVVARRRDRQ